MKCCVQKGVSASAKQLSQAGSNPIYGNEVRNTYATAGVLER